jgi:hypothetical protein
MNLFKIINYEIKGESILIHIEPNEFTNEVEVVPYKMFGNYLNRHEKNYVDREYLNDDGDIYTLSVKMNVEYYFSNESKDTIFSDLYDFISIHNANYSAAVDNAIKNISNLFK